MHLRCVTRLWSYSKAGNGHNGNGEAPSWPAPGEAQLVAAPAAAEPERYQSRRPRPIAQLAVRVGLWGAVLLGCLGGVVSLFRSPTDAPEPVVVPAEDGAEVPAPVARMAEVVAEEWLTATPDEEERLATLFLQPPSLQGVVTDELSVGRVNAIAGRQLQEGYWAVTVEVAVTETVPVVAEDAEDPAAAEDGPVANQADPAAGEQEQTVLWLLDVPIVGQVDGGLVALTTPAVLPERPAVSTGWEPSLTDPQPPAVDDATASTVEGFLDALLAGAGDPDRYLEPGLELAPAEPAPFTDVEVVTLAVDEMEEGEYRVLAEVAALTAGGARQRFSYELVVVERVDRLEVTQFSGAPSLVAGSPEPPESEEEGS